MDSTLLAGFAALGHDTRLEIVRLLNRCHPGARAAGEIAQLLAVVPGTLSTHLAILEAAGLIASHRDGRHILYASVPEALAALAAGVPRPNSLGPGEAPKRPFGVLFICSGNSARSIMAEAILNRFGAGRFRAASVGSRPRAHIEPEVVRLLDSLAYDTAALTPKSWTNPPPLDAIDLAITLCDEAAGEQCPTWIGTPVAAHWGIPDPVKSPPDRRKPAVRDAYRQLSARITELIALPVEDVSRDDLIAALHAIARFDGATDMARLRVASSR